jgi:hypothetical protein
MLQRRKCQQKISLDLPHISRVRCNYGGNAKEENNGYAVFISYLWPYDLYGPVHNAFDARKSFTRKSGRGLGPGNQYFFGPSEMAASRQASAI